MAPMMIILMAKLAFSFLDQSMTRTENLLKTHENELHRVSTAWLNQYRKIELTMIVAAGWCTHWVRDFIVGWSEAGARGEAIKQTNNWRGKFKRSRWKEWEGSHCWRHLASKKITMHRSQNRRQGADANSLLFGAELLVLDLLLCPYIQCLNDDRHPRAVIGDSKESTAT